MRNSAFLAALLLLTSCAATRTKGTYPAPAVPAGEKQYAVILSMDAFRWDLASRSHTPTLDSLQRAGTYAEIYPVYPSNTFPSHYAMATGLHPDHHGVVNNSFYDKAEGRLRSVFDSVDVRTPGFWGGEPIWNTAERQGRKASIFMWTASDVPVGGRQASEWTPYSSKPTYYERADWVIGAMTRPEAEIPDLVMWYFEQPDTSMHTYGPDSPEAAAQAEHIDSVLRYFFREIRRSPVFDPSISSSRPTTAWPRSRPSVTSTSITCSTPLRSCASSAARPSASRSRSSTPTRRSAPSAARATSRRGAAKRCRAASTTAATPRA